MNVVSLIFYLYILFINLNNNEIINDVSFIFLIDHFVIIFLSLLVGKMFKAVDLSKLVTFFAIFHNDKPVDWLLDHMIQTKVCRFDRDSVSKLKIYIFEDICAIENNFVFSKCTPKNLPFKPFNLNYM